MGGENAPTKNIEGLNIFIKKTHKNDFLIKLFGNEKILDQEIRDKKISKEFVEIINTDGVVSDDDTPLTAIKNSKILVWNSVQSQLDGRQILLYLQEIQECY